MTSVPRRRFCHIAGLIMILSSSWLKIVAASALPDEPTRLERAATRLLPLLDLERDEMRGVKALAERGDGPEAVRTWRDALVTRMRKRDYHEFYQHDYSRHWRQVGIADMLAGVVAKEKYLEDASRTGFLDIFDMAGPPDRTHRINWFAQPEDVEDWGNPEIASWSLQKKRSKISYGCLHFGRSFVARYWETGDPVYRDKWMQIMEDFVVNHYRMFWEAYRRGEVHTRNRETMKLYYTDWRENVNALDTAVRARNLVVFQAGLAKCLGEDKPETWGDILKPLPEALPRARMEALPADQMAEIAISLIEHHSAKVIRFVSRASVPNQRLTGLKTLLCLSATYPNFKHAPALEKAFRINMSKVLEDNYLPDGGNLEQSFNYNHGELRELEVILGMFGDNVPPFAETLRDRIRDRRAMDDGLRTPLGGLPQVGNHSSFTSRGKDVWTSPQALQRYLDYCRDAGIPPRPEPQPYLSKGYAYSGYYAMRGGWDMTDPYLFFMAGRPQSGHHMHDANSVQITAHGRNLVVCDGAPTYGFRHTPETEVAAFAVAEQCGWKVNTVLVDGLCQARDERSYSRAPQTPVRCRWHSSETFDLVDNLCDRGYWQARDPHGKPDHSVTHRRVVIFPRQYGFWLIEDRMNRSDDTPRTYAQTWNFAPKLEADRDYARKQIDGFTPDQFDLQPDSKRFATTDPHGPNIEFLHLTPGPVRYRKYYGDETALKGWFAPGLGSLRAAPDVHVEWESEDSDLLVTLAVPRDKHGASPIAELTRRAADTWFGFDADLQDGTRLGYRTSNAPQSLRIGQVAATATALLVIRPPTGTDGQTAGIVHGAKRLVVGDDPVALSETCAEFAVKASGKVTVTPIPMQRSPFITDPPPFLASEPVPPVTIEGEEGLTVHYTVDGTKPTLDSSVYSGPVTLDQPATVKARYSRDGRLLPFVASRDYRPVFYAPRQPDYPLSETFVQGLACAEISHPPGCRIYDLMLQEPDRVLRRRTWQLEEYAERTNYGLKQTCLIRIPKTGFWRFHLERGEAATAAVVVRNPETDLRIGPVASVGWWAETQTGSVPLEAGYHCLDIQYGCFYNTRNGLQIEIEGPGIARQTLPDEWLFVAPADAP